MNRFRIPPALLAFVLSAGVGACSSPEQVSSDGHGGAVATSGSGGTVGTAGKGEGGENAPSASAGAGAASGGAGGASQAGGAGQTAGAGGSSRRSGQVTLFNLLPQDALTMSASFVASTTGPAACSYSTSGACTLGVCGETPAAQTLASAGTLTVTSPDLAGMVTMSPAADGSYSKPVVTFEHAFVDQGQVSFKASGGAVPAFETSVPVPLVLLLSQPAFVASTPAARVARDQDAKLVWSRGAAGTFIFVSGTSARSDGQPGYLSLACQMPGEAGTGLIPASLLQQLAVGTGLVLYTLSPKTIQAGDYDVTLLFVTGVANPDNATIPKLELN